MGYETEAFKCSSSTLFFFFFLLLFSTFISCADAEVHYHEFVVHAMPVRRLCRTRNIIAVNGQVPGPTLEARNGDTLIIYVTNRAKYNVTIHWHGVRQLRTAWADGPEYVTQCPIAPGGSYRYRFKVEDQEGTLWWHAHSSWLRATVYGILIIYPARGSSYPFQRPHREFPVILGEWWNKDPIQVIRRAIRTGAAPNVSDAFTINGQPGDLYNCSSDETTIIPVAAGETNLLRFINAAVNHELFISVAGHSMTVVAADAEYTAPFTTSLLMLGPGQTTDVLLVADQPAGRYYLAARAFISSQGVDFDNTTTTAILEYDELRSICPANVDLTPVLPDLPDYNDTAAADAFSAGIRSPAAVDLPGPVDHNLFVTVGLGQLECRPGRNCSGPNGTRLTASMNNVSFDLPSSGLSMLQAHRLGVPGVFTADFPAAPPVEFDYISSNVSQELLAPESGTKVYPLEFGAVVQVVMQGTGIVTVEEHPMHVHGYHFYVLATGTGNFDPESDPARFNLIDPPFRNTVGVPAGGWAVIRFVADNPGVWLVHCHLDVHISWGLAMAFLVEDGEGSLQSLEAPPPDLPSC